MVPGRDELFALVAALSASSFFLLHLLIALLDAHCSQVDLFDVLRQWLDAKPKDAVIFA